MTSEDVQNMFILHEERELADQGERAKATLKSLQGATARTLEVIERLLAADV
jgi:hypothetical protein